MWNDVLLALRQLRLNRGFALIAIATLALGIGANTAIFTVMNTIMLRPLPYHDPGKLVVIHRTSPQSEYWPHSVADFLDIRRGNSVFAGSAVYHWNRLSVANPGEPAQSVRALLCSADFFSVLGAPAALGRTFAPGEDQPGCNGIVVLSDSFWRLRFGADPNVVGKKIRVDGQMVEVIGVMPATFDVPQLWSPIEVWRPLTLTAGDQNRGNRYLHVIARLKPDVTRSMAEQQLNLIAQRLEKTYPETNSKNGLRLAPLHESIGDRSSRRFAWLMLGLTVFVLMIACVNLANLQLARAAARSRELAVRVALGASRLRLMRQLLVESLVIAALGATGGILISIWLSGFLGKQLDRWSPNGIPMPTDWRVLTFALLCAILTGLAFGIGPAWAASRANVNDALKSNTRGSTANRAQNFFRHVLIISQVALALVLLTGSALFTVGLRKFVEHQPGWNPENLLVAWLPVSSKYKENYREFYKVLNDRLRGIPGVRNVALSASLPIWSFGSARYFFMEGQPLPEIGQEPLAAAEVVTPSYFETLGISLKQGRLFTADDDATHPNVVIINEAMAQKFWPSKSPMGQRIRMGGRDDGPSMEIVGVVNDLHFPANLNRPETLWQTYRPLAQETRGYLALHIRTDVAPGLVATAVRGAVSDIDPDTALNELDTARATIDRLLGHFTLASKILTGFSYLGLTLAALGIYGVMSYLVIQRLGELGIRLALGATARQIGALLINRALLLAAIGVIIGLVAATLVARLLANAVPEVPASDVQTFSTVVVVVITVTLAAVAGPAIKAMRIDPANSLRTE